MDNPKVEMLGLPSVPDPHGRAALLLVESLIHGLTARGDLSVADAVEIMEAALDTSCALADDAAPPAVFEKKAVVLLASILASMRIDLPDPDAD